MGGRGNRRDLRLHAMTMRATQGINALTEKEKQTLRLIVRGHDAKSIARNLDLSVHTINERLRDARRKLTVRSEEHTSELQSLMRISYAVFCLKKTNRTNQRHTKTHIINK